MSLGGKPHSPGDCHMRPALSSLKFMGHLLQKENENIELKRKQKVLRSIKVAIFKKLAVMYIAISYSIMLLCMLVTNGKSSNVQALVLVVQLLNMHKDEIKNDPEVCTACFEIFIYFLKGNSRKNKSYITGMMRHIFTSSVRF